MKERERVRESLSLNAAECIQAHPFGLMLRSRRMSHSLVYAYLNQSVREKHEMVRLKAVSGRGQLFDF